MKLKIDTESTYDEFFDNTRILGIVVPMEQYKFIWNINQILNFDFRVNHLLEIQLLKKDRNYFFSLYEYYQKGSNIEHLIYDNQHDGEYLLPEFRNLDFLWLLKSEIIDPEEMDFVTSGIKSIPTVQMVVEIPKEKIKNKQHLIL